MSISPAQIRAARGLLGWSQKELGARSGIAPISVTNIELGERLPKVHTIEKIIGAFDAAGVEFGEQDTVKRKGINARTLEGSDWFNQALEDAYLSLLDYENAELIVDMADDRQSPPEVIGLYKKIRNAGIKMRQTVEEGNSYLLGAVSEYRWIPKEFFRNWVMLVYADKVVLCLSEENRALLIKNKSLADMERQKFDLVWSLTPPLTVKSTANERY
jgi:transcriptional regulator with XRE-family HTH domain